MFRAMFGTDNALKVTNPALTGTFADWWTTSGIPGAGLGLAPNRACIDQNGWVSGMNSAANGVSLIPVVLTGLVPANAGRLTICFKLKVLSAISGNYQIFSLAQEAAPTAKVDWLFTTAASWLTGQAVGTELFVEVFYTRSTGVVAFQINGTPQPAQRAVTLSAAGAAAWDAGKLAMNFVLSGIGDSGTTRFAVRDIYVIDDVAGDGITGSIGQHAIRPVALASATGAGWTPSSGSLSLADTMNQPLPSAVVVKAPADKTPIVTTLAPVSPITGRITAVSLYMLGNGISTGPCNVKVEVGNGSTALPAKILQAPSAGNPPGVPIAVLPKSIDNGVWSAAKIAALSIKITPDTSA